MSAERPRRPSRPSLAGRRQPERLRSGAFAMLGMTVMAGLCMVALFARAEYPVLSMGPLPLVGGGPTLDGGLGLDLNLGSGEKEPGVAGSVGSGASLASLTDLDPATGAPIGADATNDGLEDLGGLTSDGGQVVFGNAGGPGSAAVPSAVLPAQLPTEAPEPEPVATPVLGSSSDSGLFVRSSVQANPDEGGEIAESTPVTPAEPEAPVEPEVPAGPELPVEPIEPPLPPAEIPPAPEPPVEPEIPTEAPAPEAEGVTESGLVR